jgi:hypothetical protein
MRTSLLVASLYTAAAAGAASGGDDVSPPVIALDLGDYTPSSPEPGHLDKVAATAPCQNTFNAPCQDSSLHALSPGRGGSYCHNATGLCVHDRAARTCEVQTDDSASCPLPNATAYDHHDEANIEVTRTTVLYIESRPHEDPEQVFHTVPDVDYSLRAEYIVYFDATDRAGNRAEQIPFSMVIADHVCPVFSNQESPGHIIVQSCDSLATRMDTTNRRLWNVWTGVNATDAYDGDASDTIVVTVTPPSGVGTGCLQSPETFTRLDQIQLDTFCIGNYSVAYTAHDEADLFGLNGADNACTKTIDVEVIDICPPHLFCKSHHIEDRGEFGDDDLLQRSTLDDRYTSFFQECADKCFQYNWEVMAPTCLESYTLCKYFQVENKTCSLYSSDAAPLFGTGDSSSPQQGNMIGCDEANIHECATPYTDDGALCIDIRDSSTPTGAVSIDRLDPTISVPVGLVAAKPEKDDYTVHYQCLDLVNNTSPRVARTVHVRDTIKPTLSILGGEVLQLMHWGENTKEITALQSDAVSTCLDLCDGDINNNHSMSHDFYKGNCGGVWQCRDDRGFWVECSNANTPVDLSHPNTSRILDKEASGIWGMKYTCTDGAGNVAAKCRTIEISGPILNLICDDYLVYEASVDPTDVYTDCGATCTDIIYGDISPVIVTTGQMPDLTRPGEYVITYNCMNPINATALEETRTVYVRDTKCPTCAMNQGNHSTTTVEASFPYDDYGAVCTDDMDGALPYQTISNVNVESTGTYYITYKTRDAEKNWNSNTYLINATDRHCKGSEEYVRTVVVIDTLKPVVALKYPVVNQTSWQVIQTSAANDQGSTSAGIVDNPAADVASSTLVAEVQQHANYRAAALAMAGAAGVAGLALLAMAKGKHVEYAAIV